MQCLHCYDAGPYRVGSLTVRLRKRCHLIHIAKAKLWHWKFKSYKAKRLVSALQRHDINFFVALPGSGRGPPSPEGKAC